MIPSSTVVDSAGDIAVWIWSKLTHEVGMFLTALIAFACLVYLTNRGFKIIQQRRRFSLRDMLVVLTFVVAVAGLIKGMINEEDNGIPRFELLDEIDRQRDESR